MREIRMHVYAENSDFIRTMFTICRVYFLYKEDTSISFPKTRNRRKQTQGQGAREYAELSSKLERNLPVVNTLTNGFSDCELYAWGIVQGLDEGNEQDYDRKGLFRLPQISIDCLDDVAKECFLDLGLFLGNKKICVDALLTIWVYV
ncbi:hypothetical protein SUGI_0358650 [Cryptomeria japonica]|nr:hypothetical protein SUGI_0358650 [Cryptomeria japonica]